MAEAAAAAKQAAAFAAAERKIAQDVLRAVRSKNATVEYNAISPGASPLTRSRYSVYLLHLYKY